MNTIHPQIMLRQALASAQLACVAETFISYLPATPFDLLPCSRENLNLMRLHPALLTLVILFPLAATSQQVEFRNPPQLSKPNGYTHVVVVNGGKLIFISGQVGMDKEGKISGDFSEQARQAFSNLQTVLTAAGAKPANLVKLNYYVVGLTHDKLLAIREARGKIIDKDHPPASTLAGVQALFREDVQLEIEAEAILP
jgi:2-iminobutanoate/2-iminopropanoate deaminase